jgi:hypothetical protein
LRRRAGFIGAGDHIDVLVMRGQRLKSIDDALSPGRRLVGCAPAKSRVHSIIHKPGIARRAHVAAILPEYPISSLLPKLRVDAFDAVGIMAPL